MGIAVVPPEASRIALAACIFRSLGVSLKIPLLTRLVPHGIFSLIGSGRQCLKRRQLADEAVVPDDKGAFVTQGGARDIMRVAGLLKITPLQTTTRYQYFRAIRESDDTAVIVKTASASNLSDECAVHLEREEALLDQLKSGYTLTLAHSLGQHAPATLHFKDFDAEPLERIIATNPPGHLRAIQIAIQIARGLEDLHGAGFVHCGLNPAGILVSHGICEIRLHDLSTAVQFEELPTQLMGLELAPSLVAYLAPEIIGGITHQTASTWTADTRADLYAFGCILYELLTGAPPFETENLRQLIHGHLARLPIAPNLVLAHISIAMSKIVLKLLAKAPDQRYQSVSSLLSDLEFVERRLSHGDTIPTEFVPGTLHHLSAFRIAEGIFGREIESSTLADAFTATDRVGPGFALVSGSSGIGKTKLIKSVLACGHFAKAWILTGKHDQVVERQPFTALAAMLTPIVNEVLASSSEEQARFLEKIQTLAGDSLPILAELIPGLAKLTGSMQSKVDEAPETVARRLRLQIKRLLRGFATEERPIVMFFDDLQWSNRDALNLIRDIVFDDDLQHIFVVGAFRTDFDTPPRMLEQWLEQLDRLEIKPKWLKLGPISAQGLVSILAASEIRCNVDPMSIAQGMVTRCQGNPFQIRQFLIALQQVGIIAPHPSTKGWLLRTDALSDFSREDTACLLMKQLNKLPSTTLDALRHASCLGAQISIKSLAVVFNQPEENIELVLQPAIEMGLVRKLPKNGDVATTSDSQYAFIHDRVQDSAYQMLEVEERATLHLKIGRALLEEKHTTDEFFVALEQLNYAQERLSSKSERRMLAGLNLKAGLLARQATAFAQALDYFRQAAQLYPTETQTNDISTLTKLRFCLAEAEHLAGDRSIAKKLVQEALMFDTPPLDRADLFDLLIVLNTLEGNYAEAIEVGRSALFEFGLLMPEWDLVDVVEAELVTARQAMLEAEMSAEKNLAIANEITTATFRIMINLLPPTDFAQPLLNSWLAAKGVILSQKQGHSPESVKLLVNLANALAERGDYEAASTLAEQALTSVTHVGAERMLPRILYTVACYIHHWTHPIAESRAIGEHAFRSCEESGEDQYAGYVLAFHRTINELFVPEPLQQHQERLLGIAHFAKRTRNTIASDVVSAALDAVRLLRESELDISRLGSDDNLSDISLSFDAGCNRKARCLFWILSGAVALIENNAELALRATRKAREDLSFVSSTVLVAVLPFIEVLSILRAAKYVWSSIHSIDQSRVAETISQFSGLSTLCHENFAGAYKLLCAENARAQGDLQAAMQLYDKAIDEGTLFGFPPVDAFACECAASFWSELGRKDVAREYLTKAYHRYREWGATNKSTSLGKELGEDKALAVALPSDDVPSLSDAADALDRQMMIDAVVAVGSELRLAELLQKLIELLIEGTGANKAVLMLDHGKGLQIEAQARVEANALNIEVKSERRSVKNAMPFQVIDKVAKTREPITVASPWDRSGFASDPYIVSSSISALMCLPLIRDGRLVGLVYLENALTKGAFSPTQTGVATFLAAQAALAVTNAILVENLEEKVFERTREVAQRSSELEVALLRAEQESRTKTSLLTNVSHELRTPLNAIIGFSDTLNLLHTNALTTTQAAYMRSREAEYINDIFEASTYLLELIEDLLDLSRFEHGRIVLETGDHLVEDSLQWAYNLLKREAQKKGIRLRVESHTDDDTFHGDPHRVKQILANLVNNAIKFTPPDGEVLLMATATGSRIKFEIEDSGSGVKFEDRERIFDPFIRLAPSTIPGSGIGLTLCKHLIELHGGVVWVSDSTLGGARFGFELPVGTK